ncbi:cytochrome P450 [Lignipirellula cremea]|uniref:cytochrome P450 n=1 Tax=Lignipirellula cremea TaxID=2528010 RepID=UPI0018D247B0|nr:cytochrome P450 [Lignipirellula cremea]
MFVESVLGRERPPGDPLACWNLELRVIPASAQVVGAHEADVLVARVIEIEEGPVLRGADLNASVEHLLAVIVAGLGVAIGAEQPEEFQPQRFAPEHAEAMPENAFLPFGIGPRACIGRRFAMMEGPLVLAELVRQFDVQLIEPDQTPELETQLSLHPRHGLRLRLTRH